MKKPLALITCVSFYKQVSVYIFFSKFRLWISNKPLTILVLLVTPDVQATYQFLSPAYEELPNVVHALYPWNIFIWIVKYTFALTSVFNTMVPISHCHWLPSLIAELSYNPHRLSSAHVFNLERTQAVLRSIADVSFLGRRV